MNRSYKYENNTQCYCHDRKKTQDLKKNNKKCGSLLSYKVIRVSYVTDNFMISEGLGEKNRGF